MTRFLFTLILVSIFFAGSAQTLNVLFIGNSYTHGHNMPKIFESLANSKGKTVFADSIAVSGSTLKGHTERARTFEKIKSKKWDVVFVQGFSRELARDSLTIATETIPYAKQIVDSVKENNNCVRLFLYLTWGYKNGYELEGEGNNTYLKMQENIRKGYYQMSDALAIPIAPVGMVWKDFREQYPASNLYQSDDQHPNPNGSYLAACTFYVAIFKETPVGATAPKSVVASDVSNIQKTAEKVVLNHLAIYKLDKEQHPVMQPEPVLDFAVYVNWLSIQVDNKTLYGGTYVWEFGDGNTSKKKEPLYYYAKSGTYTVTLTAKKGCHQYKMKKKVTVSNKIKNADKPKQTTKKKKK